MNWINMITRRSYGFFAPESLEGDRVVETVFPIAVTREVVDGEVVHDCAPTLVSVAPAGALAVTVETKVQPGTMMIVKNTGAGAATVGGVACAGDYVTTIMWDGNAYVEVAKSTIA